MAQPKALPKRKAAKRKPREIILKKLDPYQEYGEEMSPGHYAPMIWSEVGYDDNSPIWKLLDALHAIDQLGVTNQRPNKKPLIKLLKSTGTMWDKLLADLISRYDLVRPNRPGRPPLPIYCVSDENHLLWQARFAIKELRAKKKGKGKPSVDDAITQIARERGIPRRKVAAAFSGQSYAIRKK
jgi:hypothetical protein